MISSSRNEEMSSGTEEMEAEVDAGGTFITPFYQASDPSLQSLSHTSHLKLFQLT